MDADAALVAAWNLGMDDDGWSDAVMNAAERLLPLLVEVGCAAVDDAADTWWFTVAGIARAEELDTDRSGPS